MTAPLIQVAIAGDIAEAEEMQAILQSADITAELQPAADDDAVNVMVPESDLVAAQEALEALTEPDDLIAEP